MKFFTLSSVLVFAFSASTVSVSAQQGRPNTTNLTCQQAKAIVDRAGSIVLSTGPRTYDRFVKNRSFCSLAETTFRMTVKSRDSNSCFVGFVCRFPRSDSGN